MASETRTRKTSTASVYSMSSQKTSESSGYGSNGNKKAASLNEIHQLYSALQDLVNPTPNLPRRSRAYTTASESASSSDILGLERQYQVLNSRRMCHRSSIGRTRSNISSKSCMAKLSSERDATEDIKEKQTKRKGIYFKMVSRMGLKSKASHGKSRKISRKGSDENDGTNEMFVRQQRRRSRDDSELEQIGKRTDAALEYKVYDIDDLLEMARKSPNKGRRSRPKKKIDRKPSNNLPRNMSCPTLDPQKISSRLEQWYQLATENALTMTEARGRSRSQSMEDDLMTKPDTCSLSDIDVGMCSAESVGKSIDIDESELNEDHLPLSMEAVRRSVQGTDYITAFEEMVKSLTNNNPDDIDDFKVISDKFDSLTENVRRKDKRDSAEFSNGEQVTDETSRRSSRIREGSVRSGKETLSSKTMSTKTFGSSKEDAKSKKKFRSEVEVEHSNCSKPEDDEKENRNNRKLSRELSKKKVECWLKSIDSDLVNVVTKNNFEKKASSTLAKENELKLSCSDTSTQCESKTEKPCPGDKKTNSDLDESEAELCQNASIPRANERLPWQQPLFYNPESPKEDDSSYLTVIVQFKS